MKLVIKWFLFIILLTFIASVLLFFISYVSDRLQWGYFRRIALCALIAYVVYQVYLAIKISNDKEEIEKIQKLIASISLFEQKMRENKFYNLLDLFFDLKYASKTISLVALLLTLIFMPIICTLTFAQYFFFLLFLLWYLVSIVVGIFSSEVIYYKNKININKMDFSWQEFAYIYLIDFPKLQAFSALYNILNKKFAKKNLNDLFERFIFARISGWSYNLLIKAYWSYQNIAGAFGSVDWKKKTPLFFSVIFFEVLKDQLGYFISLTLGPLYGVVKNYKITINKTKISLNPKGLMQKYKCVFKTKNFSMEDVFSQLITKEFHEQSLQIVKDAPSRRTDFINFAQFRTVKFKDKDHVFFIGADDKYKIADTYKPLFQNKYAFGLSYTHASKLELNNGLKILDCSKTINDSHVFGKPIPQYTTSDGFKIPPRQTHFYLTGLNHTMVERGAPLQQLSEYGVETPLNVLQFKLLNNLTMVPAIEEMEKTDILFLQDKKNKWPASFSELYEKNFLHPSSKLYYDIDYKIYNSKLQNIINSYLTVVANSTNAELEWFENNYPDKYRLSLYLNQNLSEKQRYNLLLELNFLIQKAHPPYSQTELFALTKFDLFNYINDTNRIELVNDLNKIWSQQNFQEYSEKFTLLKSWDYFDTR